MKVITKNSSFSVTNTKIFEWTKLVAKVGSTQALLQGINLLSGIFIIRLLPTSEYALYTLANTMLGTMLILADGGISAGVMSQGGKVWLDKEQLGAVLVTGFNLRKIFAVVSILIAVPILLYFLLHNGASWFTSILIITSLVPSFITALSGTILEVAPKLHQDINSLQKNQIITATGRLLLSSLFLLLFPFSFITILAAGIPQIWSNIELRKISYKFANLKQKPDFNIRSNILLFVKRILPGSIYYCLSGQITIWLVSFFGSASTIAQAGALGRLSMLLNLFSVLFNTLIMPRFSRLSESRSILMKKFLQIQLLLLLLTLSITACVWISPGSILWVLGKKYSNLTTEVTLSIINGCLGLITGTLFTLSNSRGWAINPRISIPVTVAAIILGINIFSINTLKGVFTLNIFVALFEIAMYLIYNIYKINKIKIF